MYCKKLNKHEKNFILQVYAKKTQKVVFSKVINGTELYYLSQKVIKRIKIILAIGCKFIHYFILIVELVLNPLTG